MTAADSNPNIGRTPWHRYLDREHAARDIYLTTIAHASREYLTGPFPDRDAYGVVEGDAWRTYYSAGRAAWQAYRQEIEPPPPPPAPSAAGDFYPHHRVPESISGAGWPIVPTFNPNPESR